MKITLLLLSLLMGLQSPQTYGWKELLPALRMVETGGSPKGGLGAIGDGGNAFGPYQIWNIYHKDAATRDKTLDNYRRCLNSKSYSERVIKAYMKRYAVAAARRLDQGKATRSDLETVARIHNGGPRGATKESTKKYWAKVVSHLKR
ncbi:MAG: hypothetical protein VB877_17995 [Pirellulaceae bacterium]